MRYLHIYLNVSCGVQLRILKTSTDTMCMCVRVRALVLISLLISVSRDWLAGLLTLDGFLASPPSSAMRQMTGQSSSGSDLPFFCHLDIFLWDDDKNC